MTKFSYLKITKNKKIRYLKIFQKRNLYLVFLHGFMSDLEGKKPKVFFNFAKRNKLGFLALEYSGHGKSSGQFIDGNISKWSKERSNFWFNWNRFSSRIFTIFDVEKIFKKNEKRNKKKWNN